MTLLRTFEQRIKQRLLRECGNRTRRPRKEVVRLWEKVEKGKRVIRRKIADRKKMLSRSKTNRDEERTAGKLKSNPLPVAVQRD